MLLHEQNKSPLTIGEKFLSLTITAENSFIARVLHTAFQQQEGSVGDEHEEGTKGICQLICKIDPISITSQNRFITNPAGSNTTKPEETVDLGNE